MEELIFEDYNFINPYNRPYRFEKIYPSEHSQFIRSPVSRDSYVDRHNWTFKLKDPIKSVLGYDADCEYLYYYMPEVKNITFLNKGYIHRIESLYKLEHIEHLRIIDAFPYEIDLNRLQYKENYKTLILNNVINIKFEDFSMFPNLETIECINGLGKFYIKDLSFIIDNEKIKFFNIDSNLMLNKLPESQKDILRTRFKNLNIS